MAGAPVVEAASRAWRDGALAGAARAVPAECAIALSFGGASYAVMMATPAELEDFAVGFCLAEGIVGSAAEILEIETVAGELGIELRMMLAEQPEARLWARRRTMAGPVGCGLCGLDSLQQAMRPLPAVHAEHSLPAEGLLAAIRALPALQPLNLRTRAMHAAAFWTPAAGIVAVREDVGRHNALDKLCGAMARQRGSMPGVAMRDGAVLLTSRVSIEMVQKVAMAGCAVLVAVSAPTALAIAAAEAAGIALVAVARGDGFEVFSHPARIRFGAEAAEDAA